MFKKKKKEKQTFALGIGKNFSNKAKKHKVEKKKIDKFDFVKITSTCTLKDSVKK